MKGLVVALMEQDMAARRLAEDTRRTIRQCLREFLRWASQRSKADVLAFGKKDFVAWQAWLCKKNSQKTGEAWAVTTINKWVLVINRLYSCLYRAGMISENPCHNLDLLIREPRMWKRRPLSLDEITRFLESIDTSQAIGLRDRCLYELIYSSGLRINESVCLKVSDIDFQRRLMVVRGKFDKDRMVPLSEVARDFLVLFLGSRIDNQDGWVFASRGGHLHKQVVNIRFKQLMGRFGLYKKGLSAHCIRHSTATHLLENGASVRHVQELLGHANIESTARYTHVMTDNLVKVYRKHHPREHELFEVVDEDYQRRLKMMVDRPRGLPLVHWKARLGLCTTKGTPVKKKPCNPGGG